MNDNHPESDGSAAATAAHLTRTSNGVRKRAALIGIPVIAIAAFGASQLLGADETAAPLPPPPLVTVAQPLQTEIAEWDDYVGRFEASKSVEIRPQCSVTRGSGVFDRTT